MRVLFFCGIGFFLFFNSTAQNITIKGKAHPSYKGHEVVLYDFSDYVTYTRVKESIDTVDQDGFFQLKLQSLVTKPVLIGINNVVGQFYVRPDYVYGVYFPEKDSAASHQEGVEATVNISIYGNDTTELNNLIFDFNSEYNKLFTSSADVYLSPSKINAKLDTFASESRKRYLNIKSPYFKNYIDYSFADLFSNTSRGKNILYKQFIDKKPVQYNNYEYMKFINSYFQGYLKAYASAKNGGNIYNSINTYADYQDLRNQFRLDKTIQNDTLHELVLLKGLIDFYYSPDFDKQKVQSVIEQLNFQSVFPENKRIAANFLQTVYQLQAGSDAPDFTAVDKTGNYMRLLDNKGKYIYLNFFSTQSEPSLKEMNKIADLKKKFNDRVTFISVCLDDSINTYKAYLKANPKYDWQIVYNDKNCNAKKAYNIKALSGFFLINLQKQLAQSPALAPSEGIEYKFNALFRPKRKNTITGVR